MSECKVTARPPLWASQVDNLVKKVQRGFPRATREEVEQELVFHGNVAKKV
jgi:hypothetical protein